jgi:hypothetical protein
LIPVSSQRTYFSVSFILKMSKGTEDSSYNS